MCLANSDIQVSCGPEKVYLEILLCPIYFNGYNESLLALNSQHSKQECKGTADWTVDPPVVKFNFSITQEAINVCSNTMTVGEHVQGDAPWRVSPFPGGLTLVLPSGHGGGGDRRVCRLLQCSVRLRLRDGVFQGPQHGRHHLPRGGDVPVLLPLPAAVPGQQHPDERVSQSVAKVSSFWDLQQQNKPTSVFVFSFLSFLLPPNRSGASLAINDNNGSFISTLSMLLYGVRAHKAPSEGPALFHSNFTSSRVCLVLFLLFYKAPLTVKLALGALQRKKTQSLNQGYICYCLFFPVLLILV